MIVLYSQELDVIAEKQLVNASKLYSSKTDWIKLNDTQVKTLYTKELMLKGKQRKPGTLELEDIPQPSSAQLFSEEFKALKKEYDDDVQSLNIAFASAAMVDGPSQVDKQSSIRAQYNARKAEYDAAVAALRTKYYG